MARLGALLTPLTIQGRPNAPTSLAATGTPTAVNLTWTAPTTGGTPTSYAVRRDGVLGPQLFTNTGAESGVTPWAAAACTVTQSTISPATGTKSFALTPAAGNADNYLYDATGGVGDFGAMRSGMVAGKTYSASGTLTVPAGWVGNAAGRERRIVVFYSAGSYIDLASTPVDIGATGRTSLTFTLPVNAVEAFVRFYNGGLDGHVVYWDDLSLVESSTAQIGTSPTTSYSDTSAVTGTTYAYTVRSLVSGYESGDSNTATGTRSAAAAIPRRRLGRYVY